MPRKEKCAQITVVDDNDTKVSYLAEACKNNIEFIFEEDEPTSEVLLYNGDFVKVLYDEKAGCQRDHTGKMLCDATHMVRLGTAEELDESTHYNHYYYIKNCLM